MSTRTQLRVRKAKKGAVLVMDLDIQIEGGTDGQEVPWRKTPNCSGEAALQTSKLYTPEH